MCAGDYDNDGRLDLFVTAYGTNVLYRNRGGRFEDVTAAAGLAVTLVPVLMGFLVRGRIRAEHENPLNRWLVAAYRPVLDAVLRRPGIALLLSAMLLASAALPLARLEDLDLARSGDELVVTVGGHRRLLALPSALRRCTVAGARLVEGRLVVRFEPDPALWRSTHG